MMKSLKAVLIFLCLFLIIFFIVEYISPTSKEIKNLNTTEPDATLSQDHEYCFMYRHEATADAPYTVEEHIVISGTRDRIVGTKTGTQSGPDMTNGYTGTLEGSAASNSFTLLYSYEIEGSKQQEVELYAFSGQNIVKHRYPLIEEDGKLVPDNRTPATDILYTREMCK